MQLTWSRSSTGSVVIELFDVIVTMLVLNRQTSGKSLIGLLINLCLILDRADQGKNLSLAKTMINIVSVGVGNVRSLLNWIQQSTDQVTLISSPSDYVEGTIVLPGVCSSRELMDAIRIREFDLLIRSIANRGGKVVGICAGFQVLGQFSEEDGGVDCLDLLPLNTVRMQSKEGPISVNGWDKIVLELTAHPQSSIAQQFPRTKRVAGEAYFNHRYGVVPNDLDLATDTFGWRGSYLSHWVSSNLYGFQFHPEKSGVFGQRLLRILR